MGGIVLIRYYLMQTVNSISKYRFSPGLTALQRYVLCFMHLQLVMHFDQLFLFTMRAKIALLRKMSLTGKFALSSIV